MTMSGTIAILIAATFVAGLLPAAMRYAVAQTGPTNPVGMSADVKNPPDKAFYALKKYFTNGAANGFELVSANKTVHVIIAKRTGIDVSNWSDWAFCRVSPTEMLDSLRDGQATLKITIEPDTNNHSFVTISPTFEGIYGIGQREHKVTCQSRQVLEKDVMAAAGPVDN